nr:8451_t:CDS:2 [Entrophospora candida]
MNNNNKFSSSLLLLISIIITFTLINNNHVNSQIIIQCGKIANSSCSPGYCCSIFGYCGQTPSHCGTDGCDPTYGVCGQVTTSNGLTSVMTTMTTTPLPTNSAQTIEASSTTPKTTSSDSSSTPTTNNSSGSFIKIHSGSLNGLFIIVMIAVLLL